MSFSIIIPLYNEEENVKILNNQLLSAIDKINQIKKSDFEIIYVDDGSQDKTFDELKKLSENKVKTIIIKHKKNSSQSAAILTGINSSEKDNLIFLDGDLQNDPDDLPNFIQEFKKGFDMVVGWRKNRKDNFITRTFPSILANSLVRLFTKSNLHDHGCAIKVLKKDLIFDDITWGDFHRLFAARVIDGGYKVSEIIVNHREREFGKSKYGLERIFKVLIDLIFLKLFKSKNNSSLYFFGLFGLMSFGLALVSFIIMCYLRFFNDTSFISTPLPMVSVFFALSGVIFFFISLLTQLVLEQNKAIDKNLKKTNTEIIKFNLK